MYSISTVKGSSPLEMQSFEDLGETPGDDEKERLLKYILSLLGLCPVDYSSAK